MLFRSEGYATSSFLNGLKNDIQPSFRLFMPKTLQQAFALSHFQEFTLKKLQQEHTTTFQESLSPPTLTQTPKITLKISTLIAKPFPNHLKYFRET